MMRRAIAVTVSVWMASPQPATAQPAMAPGAATSQSAGSALPAPVIAPTAADTAADIAFWNSVKDSRDSAELLAYLKAFPDGQFAVLARLRLDAARGADLTGDVTVREIQNRLYDLNFAVTTVSGRIDPTTTREIMSWQRQNGFVPNGLMDAEQLAHLRQQVPSKSWAALAFSGGVQETVTGGASRKEVEAGALAACFAKVGGRECLVIAAAGSQCIAAAAYASPGGVNSVFAAYRGTLADAQLAALSQCNSDQASRGTCLLVKTVCASRAPGADPTPSPSAPTSPPRRSGKGDQDT